MPRGLLILALDPDPTTLLATCLAIAARGQRVEALENLTPQRPRGGLFLLTLA